MLNKYAVGDRIRRKSTKNYGRVSEIRVYPSGTKYLCVMEDGSKVNISESYLEIDDRNLKTSVEEISPHSLSADVKKEAYNALNSAYNKSELAGIKVTGVSFKADKVTTVTFNDNTAVSVVVRDGDTFSKSSGIEECIKKKIYSSAAMSKVQNLTKAAINLNYENVKNEERLKENQARIALKKEKDAVKKAEKLKRKAEADRKATVEIQAEAFLLAMKMYDESLNSLFDICE